MPRHAEHGRGQRDGEVDLSGREHDGKRGVVAREVHHLRVAAGAPEVIAQRQVERDDRKRPGAGSHEPVVRTDEKADERGDDEAPLGGNLPRAVGGKRVAVPGEDDYGRHGQHADHDDAKHAVRHEQQKRARDAAADERAHRGNPRRREVNRSAAQVAGRGERGADGALALVARKRHVGGQPACEKRRQRDEPASAGHRVHEAREKAHRQEKQQRPGRQGQRGE